jgi:hypothetical protein
MPCPVLTRKYQTYPELDWQNWYILLRGLSAVRVLSGSQMIFRWKEQEIHSVHAVWMWNSLCGWPLEDQWGETAWSFLQSRVSSVSQNDNVTVFLKMWRRSHLLSSTTELMTNVFYVHRWKMRMRNWEMLYWSKWKMWKLHWSRYEMFLTIHHLPLNTKVVNGLW